MHGSPLILTARLLTQAEILRLREFAVAPLDDSMRRHAQTLALLDLLIRYHPALDSETLAKDRVAAQLFPDKSGDTARAEVERVMSQLLLIIQRFLCVNQLAFSLLPDKMTSPASQLIGQLRQHLAMMRFYNRSINSHHPNAADSQRGGAAKSPDNLALNHYNRAQRVLERNAVRFADFTEQEYGDFYYLLFQLEYEKHYLLNLRHDQRTGFMGLPEVIEKLDASYYSAKLDLIGRLLHFQRMMQEKNADEEMQQWLDANIEITRSSLSTLRAHKQKYPAAVTLYSALVELLGATEVGQTDEAATRLWQLVQANPDSLPKPRMEVFFTLLRGYWFQRYRQTRSDSFLASAFESYQVQLEANPVQEAGFPSTIIQGMAFTAIKLGRYAWAEAFLKKLKPSQVIGDPHPQLTLDIIWARLLAFQNKIKEAADKLPNYYAYGDTDDIYLYSFALCTDHYLAYRTNALLDENGINMSRATEKRIKENKSLPEARREERLHFIRYIRKLYRIKDRWNRRESPKTLSRQLAELTDEIRYLDIADKEWLAELADELRRQFGA
ncbi:MAG: hypothetical protein ACK4NS_11030 [Saprospiraceae bacterium]